MSCLNGQVQTMSRREPTDWHRVAPVAVVHFFLKGAINLIRQGWQGFAGFAAAVGISGGETRGWLLLGGVGGLALVLLTVALLRYWFFQYRIASDRFELRQGVLGRKALSLHFERVQAVNIIQPLYFKPFSLVTLRLESAGSGAQEVDIAGVPEGFAQTLRKDINRHRAEARMPLEGPDGTKDAPEAESQPGAAVLLAQPVQEVMKYGLVSNQLWVFAAAAGSFFGVIFGNEESRERFMPLLRWIGEVFQAPFGTGLLAEVMAGLALAVTAFLVIIVLLISASLYLYFDFHLLREGDGLRRRAGLLVTRDAFLSDSKIQCLVHRITAVGRLVNRGDIQVIQAGGMRNPHQAQGPPVFLIPGVDHGVFEHLAQVVLPDYSTGPSELSRVHRLFITKTLLYKWIVPSALATAAGLPFIGLWAVGALAVPVAVLPLIILRWRRLGYHMAAGYAWVSDGLIGRSLTLFPVFKTQRVTLSQSPAQRRHYLATLRIDLAGKSLRIPYMPLQDARTWQDRLLYAAETSAQSWI